MRASIARGAFGATNTTIFIGSTPSYHLGVIFKFVFLNSQSFILILISGQDISISTFRGILDF